MANGLLTAHLEGVCSTIWACPSKWSLVVNFTRESGLKESRHTCQTYPDSWDACWVFSKTQISFTLGKKKRISNVSIFTPVYSYPKSSGRKWVICLGDEIPKQGRLLKGTLKFPFIFCGSKLLDRWGGNYLLFCGASWIFQRPKSKLKKKNCQGVVGQGTLGNLQALI